MEFNQQKLTKEEWESIEVPVTQDKLEVLKLIINGYNDVNLTYNKTNSLLSYLKVEKTKNMHEYLYTNYFSKKIYTLYQKYNDNVLSIKIKTKIQMKTSDIIRIKQSSCSVLENKIIYEFLMIDFIDNLFMCKLKNDDKWLYYYFTIYKIFNNKIININTIIKNLIQTIITHFEKEIDFKKLIYNSVDYVEKNENLIKYGDIELYDHQKKIYSIVKKEYSKLILYIAPTGTGKTLTPLGLSQDYKIIYVCAARHVGLALAKSAISIEKKIAFAFGCSSADDIKLHYFSAKEYSINKKSGGIKKIDNSVGEKVEIMICDVQSYLPAMYYMLAQNFEKQKIITYLDEPTIFLDYKNHPLHEIIHKNWKDNLIPNIVLSSATLPKEYEIPETINDFKEKFENSIIFNVISHECKKTIPLINKFGFVEMPHYIDEDIHKVKQIAEYCLENLTLLRYLDLNECVKFIHFVEENDLIGIHEKINRNFSTIDDINMKTIKIHYLTLLKNLNVAVWKSVYINLKVNRKKIIEPSTSDNSLRRVVSLGPGIDIKKEPSFSLNNNLSGKPITKIGSEQLIHNQQLSTGDFGIYITTKDAYTLTDGPTLFIVNNIDKIAQFCIQQSNIPEYVMTDILEKIAYNDKIKDRIVVLEKELEDIKEKKINKEKGSLETNKKKTNSKISLSDEDIGYTKTQTELDNLYQLLVLVSLNETFVPNKMAHLKKWTDNIKSVNSFTSDISEEIILKIMSLNVESSWKILLLLGIGVFSNNNHISYNEIMKYLAENQKLYLIIANSDYIYGVNYQFCHSYIGKDMEMTQEKIIQALGRVGRGNLQQNYTIRFRNDEHIKTLFNTNSYKPEVYNMNVLFNSKNIVFDEKTQTYIEK
jgi:hypothetical protein